MSAAVVSRGMLQLASVAGFLVALIFIAANLILALNPPPESVQTPSDFSAWISEPDVSTLQQTVAHTLTLGAFLFLPFAVVLYRVLRSDDEAYALFGGILAVASAILIATHQQILANVVRLMARRYPGAGVTEQAALTAVRQGSSAVIGALADVSIYGLSIAILAFGASMLRGRKFPKWLGWWGIILSILAIGTTLPPVPFILPVNVAFQVAAVIWVMGVAAQLYRRSRIQK